MERDTLFMDRKIQYYKVVVAFQIDAQIYFIIFKINESIYFDWWALRDG